MEDLVSAVRLHLEALKREPVVRLEQARHLHQLLADLRDKNPTIAGIAYIESVVLEMEVLAATRLLDRIERILEGASGSVEELARRVARDDLFKLINRNMRRSRAQFDALRGDVDERIPIVNVGAYTRQGRPVRRYSRYVGYVHLKRLPGLDQRPVAVQQVVRCLVVGEHRLRPRPTT